MKKEITFLPREKWVLKKTKVIFLAEVDSKQVYCAIHYETLDDKFQADFKNPLPSFRRNRHHIEKTAEGLIRKGCFENDGSILIRAGDL